jgi:hypothetical protein
MGGAVATPLSAPLNSTTHPRTRTLGATALVPGERLPAPYTLNSEEEARAAGYTEQQIHSYLASFEYFQRTNKAEASPARSSLVLYDPEPALLLPGAAGLVLPRSNGGVPAAGTATAAAAAAAAAALPPHVQRARALTGGTISECQVVVVGAGLAAGHLAKALAQQGCTGVCLIGQEILPPYDRTLLAKKVLSAQTHWSASLVDDPTPLLINPPDFFSGSTGTGSCTWVGGVTVEHIDVANRVVATSAGTRYKATSALVLATGCRAASLADANILTRTLRGGGRRAREKAHWAKCGGVHFLRTHGECARILAQIRDGGLLANTRAVIVGAGLTGLEVAAALLAQRVNNITIVHRDATILPAVFTPTVAQYYESVYRTANCAIAAGVSVVDVSCDGETGWVNGVHLSDGTFVAADLCVVAVGVTPNTELVRGQLDLTPDGGVVVDSRLRASSAGVYAIGDIAASNKGESRFTNSSYAEETAIVAANAISTDIAAAAAAAPAPSAAAPLPGAAASSASPFLTLDYSPRWSSYSTFLRIDWVAFGILSGAQTIEFGIDSVLAQQLQFENAMVAQNQQRRRDVQGHASCLIDANSPVKDRVKVETRFGVWFIDQNAQVNGGFLAGATDAEKAAMQQAVVARAQWPLPGWE